MLERCSKPPHFIRRLPGSAILWKTLRIWPVLEVQTLVLAALSSSSALRLHMEAWLFKAVYLMLGHTHVNDNNKWELLVFKGKFSGKFIYVDVCIFLQSSLDDCQRVWISNLAWPSRDWIHKMTSAWNGFEFLLHFWDWLRSVYHRQRLMNAHDFSRHVHYTDVVI